jgi:hypothetical protein
MRNLRVRDPPSKCIVCWDTRPLAELPCKHEGCKDCLQLMGVKARQPARSTGHHCSALGTGRFWLPWRLWLLRWVFKPLFAFSTRNIRSTGVVFWKRLFGRSLHALRCRCLVCRGLHHYSELGGLVVQKFGKVQFSDNLGEYCLCCRPYHYGVVAQ